MAVIWLVEDNADFRDAIQCALGAHASNHTIHPFERCEEALAGFKPGQTPPEVILLDVGLPGMSGLKGIVEFKKIMPEVNILILTVNEDDDKIFKAICAGASGYLLKSEPIKSVISHIEQAITGGAPMNPRVARRVMAMFSELATEKKDYGLTEREETILQLIVEGLVKKQIADRLDLNPHTVNYLIRRVYQKLHVNCQAAAVTLALKEGLVKK